LYDSRIWSFIVLWFSILRLKSMAWKWHFQTVSFRNTRSILWQKWSLLTQVWTGKSIYLVWNIHKLVSTRNVSSVQVELTCKFLSCVVRPMDSSLPDSFRLNMPLGATLTAHFDLNFDAFQVPTKEYFGWLEISDGSNPFNGFNIINLKACPIYPYVNSYII